MGFIDDFIQFLGVILIVINAILYTRSYIHNKTYIALSHITLYLITTSIIMVVSTVLAYNGFENIYLSHLYFIFQFIFLSFFYYSLFNSKQKRIISVIFIVVVITLLIQYIKTPSLLYSFNLFEIFITSLPLVIYSLIHLYNSLSGRGKYMFINSGVLIYLTSSTLIFIIGSYLADILPEETSIYIWFTNKVLYVIYLLLILKEWKKTIWPLSKKL